MLCHRLTQGCQCFLEKWRQGSNVGFYTRDLPRAIPHCPCSCALLHVRVELIHNIKNYVLQRCACPPHHFALLYPQVGAVTITPPQPCRRIRDHSLQKSTLHLLHQKKGRIQSFRQIPHNDLRCCVDSGDLIFLSCGPTWAPPAHRWL